MSFLADLHIHSHYSIATSKKLIPEYLDAWARIKGISVVGTGDLTHPGWLAELREKLEPAEPGLYRLKTPFEAPAPLCHPTLSQNPVRFLLSAEISNIYKRGGKTRKVHNLVFMPSFESAEKLQGRLDEIGNITSDGRPILGLDSRDLLEICLEVDENMLFVPAHIWTPWFSAMGSKSGFDSIDEAYADLAGHIRVVETGLSADPPMHWMASHLDRFAIMSNSDAHSPEKLGREANRLDTEMTFNGIVNAYRNNDPNQLLGTVEFYPQEGKYHFDGHRKCDVCWDPVETLAHGGRCAVCGKPVTVGVMHRAVALSDRAAIVDDPSHRPYWSAIPLKEILSEIEGVGPNSKRVGLHYHQLIDKLGPELPILLDLDLETIARSGGDVLAEAVGRVRRREVYIQEGYDGEYGRITAFAPGEAKLAKTQESLFVADASRPRPQPRQMIPFDLAEVRRLLEAAASESAETEAAAVAPGIDENPEQAAAVHHNEGPALVLAGPGTGKTRVLTQRIARLIQRGMPASSILAVTFTNKAAREMAQRLQALLGKKAEQPLVCTFHGLGHRLLSEFEAAGELVHLMDREEEEAFLVQILNCSRREAALWADAISVAKRRLNPPDHTDAELLPVYTQYELEKRRLGLWDLDDLIYRMVRLLEKDIEALTQVVQRWPVILVDEYQDVNEAQYRLVRLLAASGRSNLMVIGDPDQAIYGFRGADAQYIGRFQRDYPAAITYALSRSYRCSGTILLASGEVLAHEGSRGLAGLDDGVKVKLSEHHTARGEAEFIARSIEALMGGLRFFSMDSSITTGADAQIDSLAQVAVLCRTRQQFAAIEKAFHDHAVPCQAVGMTPFFQKPPLRGLIDVARWIWSEVHPHLEAQIATAYPQLYADRERLVVALAGQTLRAALGQMAERMGLENHADLPRLLRMAEPYRRDRRAFIRDVTLGQGADAWEARTEQVSLMTLHAAKGLEFDAVFIPGCEEGLLPFHREGLETDLDEERRLLYVGMTRARQLLFLSHARKRSVFGQTQEAARSRFLDPIEARLLERVDPEYTGRKKTQDQMGLF